MTESAVDPSGDGHRAPSDGHRASSRGRPAPDDAGPAGDASAAAGFADRIRAATRDAHTEAESSPFIAELLAGRLPLAGYVALAGQQFFIYRELEAAAEALRSDPVAGPFLAGEVDRLPAIVADLTHLLGSDWADRVRISAPTATYVDRLRTVGGDWPAGLIAHHYTRYLGDLAGGQFIRRALRRAYGLTGDGVRFYIFDGVPAGAFRRRYRRLLDTAGWDAVEQGRFIAEVAEAFRLNKAVFAELGQRFGVPPEAPVAAG